MKVNHISCVITMEHLSRTILLGVQFSHNACLSFKVSLTAGVTTLLEAMMVNGVFSSSFIFGLV